MKKPVTSGREMVLVAQLAAAVSIASFFYHLQHGHLLLYGDAVAHINIARNYAEPWVQPLYTHPDVEKTFRQVVQVPYGKDVDVTKTCRFRFVEAGHILGSSCLAMQEQTDGAPR
jgi:Cft2 family RNA processing exonuclease